MEGTAGRGRLQGREGGEERSGGRREGEEEFAHCCCFPGKTGDFRTRNQVRRDGKTEKEQGSVCAKHTFQTELREGPGVGGGAQGEGGARPCAALGHFSCQRRARLSENVSSPWSAESRRRVSEFQEKRRPRPTVRVQGCGQKGRDGEQKRHERAPCDARTRRSGSFEKGQAKTVTPGGFRGAQSRSWSASKMTPLPLDPSPRVTPSSSGLRKPPLTLKTLDSSSHQASRTPCSPEIPRQLRGP